MSSIIISIKILRNWLSVAYLTDFIDLESIQAKNFLFRKAVTLGANLLNGLEKLALGSLTSLDAIAGEIGKSPRRCFEFLLNL
jgi:hypothetical protein